MSILYAGDLRPGAKPASSSSRSCTCRRGAALNSALSTKNSVTPGRYSEMLDSQPSLCQGRIGTINAMLKFPGDDARLDLTESNGGTQTRTAYDATSACY